MKEIAVLLLAAGSSSRMGRSKQLLDVGGVSAIQFMVNQLKSDNYDLYVVTGAYRQDVISVLKNADFTEIFNPLWEEGMGKSISQGVKELIKDSYQAVIIVAADQLLLNRDHLSRIITIWQRHRNCIVSAFYGSVKGIPTLFPRTYFSTLIQLHGDIGARKIIRQFETETLFYNLPEARLDIDTSEDYEELIKGISHENN